MSQTYEVTITLVDDVSCDVVESSIVYGLWCNNISVAMDDTGKEKIPLVEASFAEVKNQSSLPVYLAKPHKTRFENCKGRLAEPRENYGKWAYWWGPSMGGWHSKPQSKPK